MPRASDEFRAVVVETLRDWRLGQVHIRPDWAREREVFRAGMADIIRLELTAAYLPLFRVIDQIERDIRGIEILALASVLYPRARPRK